MNKTTCVKIKRSKGLIVVDCDIYIGRRCVMGGWDLPHSEWANPFILGEHATTREELLEMYLDYVISNPELMASLHELKGKVLGCWCSPQLCHGDILSSLANSD